MKYYSIGQFSKLTGVPVPTLRFWDNSDKLKAHHTSSAGHRYYTQAQADAFLGKTTHDRINVGYIRVDSIKQQDDLQRQKTLVENKLSQMDQPYIIIEDVGSGSNHQRKGLKQLIQKIMNKETDTIVTLHKDRLSQTGYDLIEYIASLNGASIFIMNPVDESD